MNMFTAHIKNTETNAIINIYGSENKNEVLNWLMKSLFEDLGNGGMSAQKNADGSIGSLWRCADEIYDCLASGGHYFYCDREFWVAGIDNEDEKDKDKEYLFRFSAVVDNNVKIVAKSYEEALVEYRNVLEVFKVSLSNVIGYSSWHYDGNINDEGDEQLTK